MSKPRFTTENIPDQQGRVAIVTGANSGIGFEAAKALAEKGAQVIVASRSEGRGSAAVSAIRDTSPKAKVDLMLLDLASLDSVRAFASAFKQRFETLDLLINNAGVMMPPSREETKDGFEMQIGTNHLGHFALTLELLPQLASTKGSRVVNVSSSAQNFADFDVDDLQWTRRPFRRMPSYGASKVANMLFSLELQRRLTAARVGTLVASVHPGWTATNLQRSTGLFRLFNPLLAMEPWQGALPTLFAAISEEVSPAGYYGPDGLGGLRGYPAAARPAKVSADADLAKRLWSLSEELVGITEPALQATL